MEDKYEPYRCKDHNFDIIKTNEKYAYITLLMLNDNYLPGVMIVGHSIRNMWSKQGKINDIDLVVMVTKEISDRAINLLRLIYDRVVKVPYITPIKGFVMPHLVKRYPHYQYTFTKLNLLNKKIFNYDKVLFLDADNIVIKNFDHLFSLDCPAAIYYGYFPMHENNYKPRLKGDKYIWHQKHCGCCDHKKKIPHEKTVFSGKGDILFYGMSVECMLLKPSLCLYNEVLQDINSEEYLKNHSNGKGFLTDTGYITYKYSGKWTGIDPRFLGRRGYPRIAEIFGITMGGAKPWEAHNIKFAYNDYKVWFIYYLNMMKKYNINDDKLIKLKQDIKEILKRPKYLYVRIITDDFDRAKQYKQYIEQYLKNGKIKIMTSSDNTRMDKSADINFFVGQVPNKFINLIFTTNKNFYIIDKNFNIKKFQRRVDKIKNMIKNIPNYDMTRKINAYYTKDIGKVNNCNILHYTNSKNIFKLIINAMLSTKNDIKEGTLL